MSAMAQRAREALGLESGSQAQHYLKYRQQHVHEYPSEYSLGEYSVAEPRSMGEVERLKPKYTECQKVHKLTARTGAQVPFSLRPILNFTSFTPVGRLLGRCCGRGTDRLCRACHCEEG